MDRETAQYYLTTEGHVFNKDNLAATINDSGWVVNGIEYWICNDIQLVMETVEDLRNETFSVRWETKNGLGFIQGDSEIFLYVNPVKSSFVIPVEFQSQFPLIPSMVRIIDGVLDYGVRETKQWKNPKTFEIDYPKNIIIIENFNHFDQTTQRFIAELSLQLLAMVVAQINPDDEIALNNLIPDYDQYTYSSLLGLVSDEEYERIV